MNLRIPGPTPCPPAVLQAQTKEMINHRGKDFADLIAQVTAKLKTLFLTKGDVFILTTSGTGGMEAAVVNTLSPGDHVLAVSCGFFGERFGDSAQAYGADVKRLAFDWGKPVEPQAVKKALAEDPSIKAILVTHNETSTGVTNDLKAISQIAKQYDKLLLVDAVSSLGSLELPVDAWGCDVVVTASQKGWMASPGLAMVSVSEKGWKAIAQAKMPRYYFDLNKAKSYLERGQTPWTPALSTFYGLAVGLDLMLQEGLESIIARHAQLGAMTRQGIRKLGLSIFPEEKYASNTVSAITVPPGLDSKRLLQLLREEHKVVLSGGQGKLDGKIFRIGHLGYVSKQDIEETLQALGRTLPKAGFAVPAAAKSR